MVEILQTYNADFLEYKSDIIKPINFDDLEMTLKNHRFDYICAVHNETGTGLLNDIDKIGAIAKKYGAEFVVRCDEFLFSNPHKYGKITY